MKLICRILFFVSLILMCSMAILPFKAHGQGTVTKVGQTRGIQENIGGEKVDSFLWLPLRIPATWTYTNVIIPNMGGLTQSPIDSNLYFQKYYNTWYRVITTNDTGSFGHGTVTSITATSGGGISATPNPITTTGTLSLTAVGTPTTVGSSTQIPVISTNAFGQVTAVATATISSTGIQSITATAPIAVSGTQTVNVFFNSISATSVPANTSTVSATPSGSIIYSSTNTATSLVERDAYGNTYANNFESAIQGNAAIGTYTLTRASSRIQQYSSGSGTCSVYLPDATTLQNGHAFEFDNNASGNVYVLYSGGSGTLTTVPQGGYAYVILTSNSFTAGQWNVTNLLPSNYSFGTYSGVTTATMTATRWVTNGGTSSQFVKGDGSLDGTTYGTGTISGLSGDVVASGTGTVSATIQPNVVTYAKMQQENQATLLGNPTGSAANPSEISLGTNLSFVGNKLNATFSSTGIQTLTATGGISASPNPITSTGTISLTAVGTPTTIGSPTQIPVITTNAYGQISAMTYSTVASSGVTSVSAVSGGGIIATPNGITTTGTVQVDTGRIPTFYDTTAIGSGSNALATRFWAQNSFITGGYTWTGANTWTNTAGQTISISGSATNTVNGFYLLNPTAATSVTPQYAPALELSGYGFKTGTGGGSQSTIWQVAQSITNGASIVNTLTFASIVNGVSYTAMTINGSSTGVTFNGTITGNNGVSISAGLTLVSGAFKINTGSNRATGTATLSSGTVTVSNTLVTSSSLIWVQYQSGSTLSGATLTRILRVSSQTAGTSFTAVAETAPGTINTSDNSNIQWGIVN